jgi:DNA-binding transcriptional regulator GbsR (MarR family)
MTLSPVAQKFILHWGEMGARWGINRTVAQIHALLYLAPRPLTAEEIAETLSVARSNVSNSLRELQGWKIVKIVHVMGDRRDHFESMKDVWEMFRIILDERKKRETDPTLAMLRDCVADAKVEAKNNGKADTDSAYVRDRLSSMLEFFELMTNWYEQTRSMPIGAVMKLVRMGAKVKKMMGAG